MDLIADIGATNSRFALLDGRGAIVANETFNNTDFSNLEGVIERYLRNCRAADRPKRAALAIAAPILNDRVQMSNVDWSFSQAALKGQLELAELVVVNDFAAVARGLPSLGDKDLLKLGGGERASKAPLAVIGPGSGLGVAALIPTADGWSIVSGEGGHASISPITAMEVAVVQQVSLELGYCSAESLLSGPGIERIYATLGRLTKRVAPLSTAAEITSAAAKDDSLASDAQAMFFSLLGTTAGNLALTVNAQGGVFIAGGIVPKIADAFEDSEFREQFNNKGRYREFMTAMPTFLIVEPQPAFLGLRKLLGYA
jgi:glucokinase